MRFGVMTDTHVGETVESCARVRQALELFRDKGAEVVINNGDIANHHFPNGYQAYRQVFEEVYAGREKPKEIYAYAWHDAFDYMRHPRTQAVSDAPAAFKAVCKALKAPHEHTAIIRHKGYVFLVMPQFTGAAGFQTWKEYEERVAAACQETPDKPVFVVDHVPPKGTVYHSVVWGCKNARAVLDKYPQVVDFTGHVHGSLRNDAMIWQGNFTVVNSGCLYGWDGLLAGNRVRGYDKQEYGVLTVDVYADRLVVRRWDVRDGCEINGAHPWVISLPFDAATAPYRSQKCRAAAQKPMFAPGASVAAKVRDGASFCGFDVTFPDSSTESMTYRISAARKGMKGEWKDFAFFDVFSGYHLRDADRPKDMTCVFPPAYFGPSSDYRISVAPVNRFGMVGGSVSTVVTAPAFPQTKVVWECWNPMEELKFKAEPIRNDKAYLHLPDGLFRGEPKMKYRLIADVRTVSAEEGQQPTLKIAKRGMPGDKSTEVYNGFGDVRSWRIFEFEVSGDAPRAYDLELSHVGGCKVSFEYLRLECPSFGQK